jgi:hypothetical protein
MVGQSSKSSESTQVRVWQIIYVGVFILFAEYLALRSILSLY